jgi:bifunctional non-homologous end joining protein LigD
MGLSEYKRKRNFKKTPEPDAKASSARGLQNKSRTKKPKLLSFVVQKHAASHLHYDFRLEIDGVLRSWAVPKGPSLDPRQKRLAVETEDHPLDYADFEGFIPQGEYGGGEVIVWDRGSWIPSGDPEDAYLKGILKFTLKGKKLKGQWHMIRTRKAPAGSKRARTPWLLIKEDDSEARSAADFSVVDEKPLSVLSRRGIGALAKSKKHTGAKQPRASKAT